MLCFLHFVASSSSHVVKSNIFRNKQNKLISATSYFMRRGMGTFVSDVNPVTGKMDWVLQDTHYDYHQEIARSAFADMLHDTERNQKYYAGVRQAVELVHGRGEAAHVLDIGTGTGLLSMMALTAGADKVTACEAFKPMAECAKRILKQNGCERVVLVSKRSTEMTVGLDGDMEERANILVTEVFDTELIGEGAISTFNHAHTHLLKTDSLVVPRAANFFAQPVHSALVRRWNKIDTSLTGIKVPTAMQACSGALSLHDLQLDQLNSKHFTALSQPLPVFRFDFTSAEGLPLTQHCEKQLEAEVGGQVDGIFTWWDCEMDPLGEITLSCAPRWAHPDGDRLQWRDHWMQAIYYPRKPVKVSAGGAFLLHCAHNEYSLHFDVSAPGEKVETEHEGMCVCGLHTTLSRSRIGMLSDPVRVKALQDLLQQQVAEHSVCLCISDGSLLPLMAAVNKTVKVFVLEPNPMYRRISLDIMEHSKMKNVTILAKKATELTPSDLGNQKIDYVLGEPYSAAALLPWHNMHLWYAAAQLDTRLLNPSARVLPNKMYIRAVAMQFDHLWKIRAPVGHCEGFDLSEFDNLIENSAAISDTSVEPQPLWEYPGTALSDSTTLLTLHSHLQSSPVNSSTQIHIQQRGRLNGVALWVDFLCDCDQGELCVSSGVRGEVTPGRQVNWDMYSRQGVHLLSRPLEVSPPNSLTIALTFQPDTGQLHFNFQT